MKMKKLMTLMLTLALLLAATGCSGMAPQEATEAQEGPVEIAEPQEGTPTPTDQEKPVQAPEKPVEGSETDAQDNAKTDAKTDNAEKKDDAVPAGGEDQDTGDSTQGNTTQGGSSSTGSSAQSNKGYDNGSLTVAQVKEMQRWYGIGADGQWGPGSKAKAGGLDADAAWAKYKAAKAASNNQGGSNGNANQGGSNQGNTGNGGNGGNGGSGVIGGSHTLTPTPQPQPTPQQPVHVHTWVPVYEEVEITEMQPYTYCVTCGQDITGWPESDRIAHGYAHASKGESDQTRSTARSVVVGTENQIVGYKCSECGEWK